MKALVASQVQETQQYLTFLLDDQERRVEADLNWSLMNAGAL